MLKNYEMILLKLNEKRLTAADLAEVLEMNKGNLSKHLTGKNPISYKLGIQIAAALDMDLADVLEKSSADTAKIKTIRKKISKIISSKTKTHAQAV